MTCQICSAPASFVYITLDTGRLVPMCGLCVSRTVKTAIDQCRAHDPRIAVPTPPPARLN